MSNNNVKSILGAGIGVLLIHKYLEWQTGSGLGSYLKLNGGIWDLALSDVNLGTAVLLIIVIGFIIVVAGK